MQEGGKIRGGYCYGSTISKLKISGRVKILTTNSPGYTGQTPLVGQVWIRSLSFLTLRQLRSNSR